MLNGLPQPDYSVDGTIVPEKDGTLTATLTLKNESGEKRAGFLCPLDMIRLIHVLDAQDAAFELGAGRRRRLRFATVRMRRCRTISPTSHSFACRFT
ncbi:MAG: hypothetical protein R3F11_27910 [Verrucomicrobiales bacterium]